MAKIRRVVRKAERTAPHHFDEQLWPVQIALVVLGGFVMGVSLAHQPLSGVAWHRTAWPSLIGVPLVIAGSMAAMAWIDNRVFRRSLQLSLVLCAIIHVGMVLQMLRTQLFASAAQPEKSHAAIIPRQPPKIVPEYHPTQLVPEEDRPRQDFEKPIEAQSAEPAKTPEQIVRQPTEPEQSPAQPQPVPVPEQQRTSEPNVVNRQMPNEALPRLAAQQSRLSRQIQPSQSRLSQPVDMPAATPQVAKAAEPQPSAAPVERQQAEPVAATGVKAEPKAKSESRPPELVRRTSDPSPATETAATPLPRRSVADAAKAQPSQIAAAQPKSEPTQPEANVVPSQTNPTRRENASSSIARQANPSMAAESRVPQSPAVARREQAEANPAAVAVSAPQTTPRRVSVAAPSTPSRVAGESTPAAAAASTRESAAQPAKLALSRGESGTAGGRRSVNVENSLAGGASPALVASSAAQRAEATQRGPAGDALSPAASARMARSRAAAEIPTATVKAEQLDSATTAGAAHVAEVTASSGAAVSRADAAGRRDAVTAAKGAGEVDFGPTQIVAEAGSGRAAGGGQPELSPQPAASALVRRSSGGPQVAIDSAAESIGAPGAESAGGPSTSTQPAAAATAAVRSQAEATEVGARPSLNDGGGPVESAAAPSLAGPALRRAATPQVGPQASEAAVAHEAAAGGSSIGRQAAAVATSGATNVAEIPEVGPRSAVAQAELDHVVAGMARTTLARTQPASSRGAALAVDIEAPAGPGGLGTDFTPEVGINTRQAQADSLNIELRSARFVRSQVGGLPAVSTAAVIPTEAFSGRAARVRGQELAGGSGSQSPQTEEAIERGLAFLARYQGPVGGWSLQGFPDGASLVSDTAATALAVLAFQGAGYNHREFQYRDVVRNGLNFLLKSQKASGDLFVPLDDASNNSVWLYSHALAAIAICEAYGMTQDPELRQPAQKAIDFIVDSQEARRGGWRYEPGVGADTSVTGWMMMALKSGELAGLDVPPAAYRRIGRWLDDAQQSTSEPHLYRYNPLAPDTPEQRHGRTASKTMTAVGLLMRLYTGWRRDNPNMARGAAYLAQNLPAIGTVREPQRDTYYWYYATQVMAHVGGEAWQSWMGRLHPLLTSSQIRQGPYGGSWDPRAPIGDRWGPHAGRLYVTAMNLLSLEVQYRKLPLYEDVAR